ncbi:unnamed protein product [Peronospora belbahrii]|uniref:PDZ domain-containing protein n=1 Tax=Peronospora belbahrii TaxID=622444 RepID=A0AAU9KFY3_9STRA|nr:unnamed protein product [Peronospora belbahrii]
MSDVLTEYENAIKAKEAIEEEIETYVAELTSGNNPGFNGSLVDNEGFPRADIDVYRVRQVRHSLAVKQTAHQLTMKKIEELLPQVFEIRCGKSECKMEKEALEAPTAAAVQTMKTTTTTDEVSAEERELQSFAVVESVQRKSPAELAGLQAQDQIMRFGSADASNHRELAAIKDIVQHNVGSSIRVLVRRGLELLVLKLTPQTWNGPGVLGCLVQPL